MDATIAMSVKGSQAVVTSIKLFDPKTASVVVNIKTFSETAKVHRFLKANVYESASVFEEEQAALKAAIEAKSVAGLGKSYLPQQGVYPCADISALHGGFVRRKVDLSKEEVIISQDDVLYIPVTLSGVEVASYFVHHVNHIAEYKDCLILRKESLKSIFSLVEFRDSRISKEADVFVIRNESNYCELATSSTKKIEVARSFLKSKAKHEYSASRVDQLDNHVFEEMAKDIEGLKKLVAELEEIQKNPDGLY